MGYGKSGDGESPCPRGDDDTGGAVYERGSCGGDERYERARLLKDRVRASHIDRRLDRAAVDAQHHVGVEHLEEGVEVALAGGGEKRLDDFALACEVRVGCGCGAAYPAACAAGELSGRLG